MRVEVFGLSVRFLQVEPGLQHKNLVAKKFNYRSKVNEGGKFISLAVKSA